MAEDVVKVATSYFDSWRAKDFSTLRSLLADDVEFTGPLAELDNADDCVQGIRGMSQIVTDIVVHKIFVSGDNDVVTWFDLHTKDTPPIPTANWSHVEGGLITRIRVAFDARPLT